MEKFIHIHFLISIIFSIVLVVFGNEKSFSPLNSSYIIEAKKGFMSFDITKLVDPPMPSYTFSIYNRDLFEKSKFKDYDAMLESKLARCQARANHLGSILENANTIGVNGTLTRPHNVHESKRDNGKVLKTTSTHFVDGEYVASFTLGTEQIKAYLLVDTGSDLVWWQCGPCEANKCYSQSDPIYDSTKSRTYQKLDCIVKSESCLVNQSKAYECTPYGNQCLYDFKYVEGSITKGWIADDVITFVLDQNPVSILFGCGRDQMSGTAFSGEYSGIAGIGRRALKGGYSLPSQFEADIMSMCLPGAYSTQGSTISFNTTPFKKKTSADLLPNYGFPTFYFVNLYKIFINDKEVPLFPSFSRDFGNYDMTGGCIVDTGTIITRFPQDFYTVFRDTFRQEAKDIPMIDVPLGSFDTCYVEEPGVVPIFPIVKMYFGQQSPDNLLLLEHSESWCTLEGYFVWLFCHGTKTSHL